MPAGCLEAFDCSLLFCISLNRNLFLFYLGSDSGEHQWKDRFWDDCPLPVGINLFWTYGWTKRVNHRKLRWGGEKTNVFFVLVDVNYELACASCYCPLTCVIAWPVIMCQLDSLIRIHLKCNANVYTHSRRDCVTMTRGERDVNCREGEEKKNKTKKYCSWYDRDEKDTFLKQAP